FAEDGARSSGLPSPRLWAKGPSPLCVLQAVLSKVSRQYDRPVKHCHHFWIVRHRLQSQTHSQSHFDRIVVLPFAFESDIRTGLRSYFLPGAVYRDYDARLRPPGVSNPYCEPGWPRSLDCELRGIRFGKARFLAKDQPFLLPVQFRWDKQIDVQR